MVDHVFFRFLSESIDCKQKSFNFEGHTRNWGKSGDIHLTNFLKTNVTKFAVIWVKGHQKVGFKHERLQNHSNKEKERARRRKGGEEKKSNGCTLGFDNSYFGDTQNWSWENALYPILSIKILYTWNWIPQYTVYPKTLSIVNKVGISATFVFSQPLLYLFNW